MTAKLQHELVFLQKWMMDVVSPLNRVPEEKHVFILGKITSNKEDITEDQYGQELAMMRPVDRK